MQHYDYGRKKILPIISQISTITYQQWFPPACERGYLEMGNPDRIVRLRGLTDYGKLLGKTDLELKLGTNIHWYKYFQIRQLIHTKAVKGSLCNPLIEM